MGMQISRGGGGCLTLRRGGRAGRAGRFWKPDQKGRTGSFSTGKRIDEAKIRAGLNLSGEVTLGFGGRHKVGSVSAPRRGWSVTSTKVEGSPLDRLDSSQRSSSDELRGQSLTFTQDF